jgi:putative membrane protein
MHKTKTCLATGVAALALTVLGCSSDEPEAEYSQPAASAGDEASPSEATPEPATTTTPSTGSAASTGDAPLSPTPPPAEPAPESSAAPMTDGQIAKITTLVNTGEVEQAQLAKTKAKNAAVKKFATMMINQHTQANQNGAQLAKKASLTPEDSPAAMELQSKATQTLESLKSADATMFDSAYMSAQVTQHQEVLDMLDNKLIPAATNPELKTELQTTRTMVQRHLTDAQAIQQTLAVPAS